MRVALLCALLLVAGCAGPDPESEVRGIRFRVDGGEIQSTDSLDDVRGGLKNRQVDAWFMIPESTCADPALLVDYTTTLHSGEAGGQPLETEGRPRGLIPVRPEQLGREA